MNYFVDNLIHIFSMELYFTKVKFKILNESQPNPNS